MSKAPELSDQFFYALERYCERAAARLAIRAQAARAELTQLSWDAARWFLSGSFGERGDIRLRLVFDPQHEGPGCLVVCSCAEAHPEVACLHALALAYRMLELLDEGARTPEDEALLADIEDSFGQGSWAHAIFALEQQAEALAGDRAAAGGDEADERVGFRVVDSQSKGQLRLALETVIQRRSTAAKGPRWTAGRRISWTHWNDPEQSLLLDDPLAPAVRRMLEGAGWTTAKPVRGAGDADADLPSGRLLLQLIGSTRVAWQSEGRRAIAVERGRLRIAVQAVAESHFAIELRLGQQALTGLSQCCALDGEHLAVVAEGRQRLLISSRLPAGLVTAVRGLLLGSLRFPRSRLVDVLAALNRLCADHPESLLELDRELESRTVAGDPRPAVELEALDGGGLALRIRALPHDEGRVQLPGFGPRTVQVAEGRALVSIERDLRLELRRAADLAEILELEPGDDPVDHEANWGFTLTCAQAAMTRVVRLRGMADQVRVFWCGPSPSLSPPLDTGHLILRINRRPGCFDLSGTLEVPGAGGIDLQDLMAAITAGQRFVEVGPGQWAHLAESLVKHLTRLDDLSVAKGGRQRLQDPALVAYADLVDPELNIEADAEWHQRIQAIRCVQTTQLPQPELKADLRSYQLEGMQWMQRMARLGLGCCLADDMGLGKTLQCLGLLMERAGEGPALVVAPLSVTDNWLAEAKKFAPALRLHLYRGSQRAELLDRCGPGEILVMSYALLQRDSVELNRRTWSTLVLDEAQAIKNPGTKVARAARDLPAKWKLALTGTPIENRLADLWSLFRVLNPGLLGSLELFNTRFVTPIERYDDRRRAAALSRIVRPFILRRTKSEVLKQLPPITWELCRVESDEPERRLYEAHRQLVAEGLKKIGNTGDRRLALLAGLTKLRQLACHPRLVDRRWRQGSGKLRRLLEVLETLGQAGHACLVFSQFTGFLDLIGRALEGQDASYLRLDGSMAAGARQKVLSAFQAGDADVMLISLKAGGTGINLTRASYVVICDPWWNPAVEDQAAARAHRIGQAQAVHCIRLVTRGSIEERVLEIHGDKRDLVEGTMQGHAQAATQTVDELVAMISEGY